MKKQSFLSQQFGFLSPSEIFCLREDEKSLIKKQSTVAGVCVILFFLIQTLLGIVSGLSPELASYFLTDPSLSKLYVLVLYTASIFFPFLTAYFIKSDSEKEVCYCFDKPVSKKSAAAAVVAGVFFCTVGNYITDYLMRFLELFGLEITDVGYAVPDSFDTLFLQLINIAVLPALLEEFAFRSVVMQPLRRFGDTFAIVMSAAVFSLMHGNIIQIPFAFIAGIAIGYFVVATGSIWTGVIIHFVNNAYSVILSYTVVVNPTFAARFYALMNAVSIVAGIICFAVFMTILKREKLRKYNGILSRSERAGAYIATAPMIITIAICFIQTIILLGITG